MTRPPGPRRPAAAGSDWAGAGWVDGQARWWAQAGARPGWWLGGRQRAVIRSSACLPEGLAAELALAGLGVSSAGLGRPELGAWRAALAGLGLRAGWRAGLGGAGLGGAGLGGAGLGGLGLPRSRGRSRTGLQPGPRACGGGQAAQGLVSDLLADLV